MGLSGSILLSSDNLPELTSEDLEYIKFLIPVYKKSAVPIDLFENRPPRVFKLEVTPEKVFKPYYLIGVFNWTKKEMTISVSVERFQLPPDVSYHVFDYWTRRYFQIDSGHIKIRHLRKNRAKFLVIRPNTGNPQLIASTFHITQGTTEVTQFEFNATTKELSITLNKPGRNQGRLYLSIPPPYREKELISDAPRSNMFRHQDGLLTIELRFENETQLILKLQNSE